MKDFQVRIYHDDDDAMMIEISKIFNYEIIMEIINFLERLRERLV